MAGKERVWLYHRDKEQQVRRTACPARHGVKQAAACNASYEKGIHMLEIQNLTKRYGKTLAADQVSFVVPDGKVGILLGPNGAGKSTVIKKYRGAFAV